MTNNIDSPFLLNPNICFLNYGSFGACVKPVFERYQQYQLELEQEPVQFMTVTGLKYLQQSLQALAAYIHAPANDLVYITNPSYGVNIIAKSLVLQPGDEILTTDLEYGACEKTLDYYCSKAGATLVKQKTNFPIESKEQFITHFLQGITPKTKMVFISHITSTTGLRLPVEEICKAAKTRGILTFIDGAHAPGQIPLNIETLQPDIYMGACHKWMLTPKGSSFLYVKKELQPLFDPLIISWGYQKDASVDTLFQNFHQPQGTRDFSAFLTTPTAIQFMKENDWETVAATCRQLTKANATAVCSILHATPLAPLTDDFILQLYSTPIQTKAPFKLKELLYSQYKIEVPIMQHFDKVYLRYSIQAFNTQQHLDQLMDALQDIIKTTSLIEL